MSIYQNGTSVPSIPGYVYRLEYKPTGQFYYGYRTANIGEKRMPVDDFWIHYFSSSTYVQAMIDRHGTADFDHDIIFESIDKVELYRLEQELIKQHMSNPLILNKRFMDENTKLFMPTCTSKQGSISNTAIRTKAKKTKYIVQWTIISPTGEVYETSNLSQFCRDHGLCSNAMGGVSKGKTQHHKGWTCTGERPSENSINLKKPAGQQVEYTNNMPWEVTNPVGEVMQIENLRHFCKENGLSYSGMRDVSYGRQQTHRGWKCVCLSKTHVKTKLRWEVIDQSGNLYIVDDLRLFCQEHGLYYQGMRDTAAGRQRTSCGWRCYSYEVEKAPVIWEVINPLGETLLVDDMKQFCKDNALSYRGMSHVANGTHKAHRGGWKCKRLD
jgi:3,4-dihydroxy-2-butanone 4-phosphate synthase